MLSLCMIPVNHFQWETCLYFYRGVQTDRRCKYNHLKLNSVFNSVSSVLTSRPQHMLNCVFYCVQTTHNTLNNLIRFICATCKPSIIVGDFNLLTEHHPALKQEIMETGFLIHSVICGSPHNINTACHYIIFYFWSCANTCLQPAHHLSSIWLPALHPFFTRLFSQPQW